MATKSNGLIEPDISPGFYLRAYFKDLVYLFALVGAFLDKQNHIGHLV